MAKRKAKKAKRATKKSNTRGKSKAKAKGRGKKKTGFDLIISKSRTKAAADLNVSGDFYGALDEAVREMIAGAEARATNNGRRTLRPHDL